MGSLTVSAHLIAQLPFVTARLGAATVMWDVSPTRNWSADNDTGAAYAQTLIDHMKAHDAPFVLGHVVKALPPPAEWTGIEIGFIQGIASAAAGLGG